MSRTPLFRATQRALELSNLAVATDRPVAEWMERAAEQRTLTRRELLRAGVVGAAGATLTACASFPPWDGRCAPEAIVIGAGIAGLSAAYRLEQAGIAVRTFEAQERIGGRMYSLRGYFPDGQVCELGGELIDTDHRSIRRLAGEVGIALDDLSLDDPALSSVVWQLGGRRRSEQEVVEAFRPVAHAIRKALDTMNENDPITRRSHSAAAAALDRQSIAEWLEGCDCEPWIHRLLDIAYTTECGLEIDEQSALNFLLLIDPNPDPFRVLGDSDERYRAHEGNDAIPLAVAERLQSPVEMGVLLEAVRQRADGLLECSLRRGSRSLEVAAPHVVLAIPFTLLRDVKIDLELPSWKRRAIDQLGYGTNSKLMIGFDERVWRTRYGSNGSVVSDRAFQTTWETSRLQAGGHGILTNFTGGRHGLELDEGTAAEQAAATVRELEAIFPGAQAAHRSAKQARFHWPSFPYARGSYACYRPGQTTQLAGAEGERIGNLHFAGEHCSLEAQGFIEGGCETGEAAARAVHADLRGQTASKRASS